MSASFAIPRSSVSASWDRDEQRRQFSVGGIRNLVPNFGIEDRADGGGIVGLASKPEALEAQLKKYAAVRV
jgi:hypothetical protein